MKKVRLSLDVTEEMFGVIESMAEREGISKGELLRRSIALWRAAKNGERDGETLAAVKDGKITHKIVGY